MADAAPTIVCVRVWLFLPLLFFCCAKAVERFGDVSDRLKASGQTFENSKQKAAGAVVKFNEAKQRRCVLFDPPFPCLPYPALPCPTLLSLPARIIAVTAAAPKCVCENGNAVGVEKCMAA